jgi:hypothetical protein
MNAALVKVDVAAAHLGWPARKLLSLVDESSVLDRGFAWVFNLANDPAGERRDLRWWWPEIAARASLDSRDAGKYAFYELSWVINRILPERRQNFQAGEVDQLFQIRHTTRYELHAEIFAGAKFTPPAGTANFYPRELLAAFLTRRWMTHLRKIHTKAEDAT